LRAERLSYGSYYYPIFILKENNKDIDTVPRNARRCPAETALVYP